MDKIYFQPPQQFSVDYAANRSEIESLKSHKTKTDQQVNKHSPALKKVCAEMESLFIYYLFKEMRATVPKSGLLNGGKGKDIYQAMIDSQLSKELSEKGGIGLSSIIYNQLSEKGDIVKNINQNHAAPNEKQKH